MSTGSPPLERPHPPEYSGRRASRETTLDPALSAAVRDLGDPAAVLGAALRILLSRYTWQPVPPIDELTVTGLLSGAASEPGPADPRLSVHDGPAVTIRLDYDPDRCPPATIERLARHLRRLAAAMAAAPDGRVADLDPLTAAERHELTVARNDTAQPYPADRCVHELVAERACRQPDAVAVIAGPDRLTYRELDEQANQLAHHLRAHGVRPESTVILCLRRGLPMIVGLLGVLKSGGAYVPLDPDYPSERLAFMAGDCGAAVVVTERELTGRLPNRDGLAIVCVDADAAAIADQPVTAPPTAAGPDHLAYVVYTSGSTGQPKGVQVEHYSLCARMVEMRERYAVTPADTMLQFSSISFDGALDQIFPPLLTGARLVLRLGRLDPQWLLAAIREHQVTLCELPPSVWVLLIDRMAGGDPLAGSVRLVGLAGEQLLPEPVRRWFGLTGVPLLNVYGPTEATVNATTAIIDRPLPRIPIGLPLSNTEVYVLDGAGRVAPDGAVGELLIGGAGVARGYLGRPELTAQRFVTRTIGGAPRRLYRTGDLVRWLPDGRLEFLGRADDQLKIRGHRIETGEIESVLTSHPAVTAAAVVARADPTGGKRLYAYCTAGDSQPGVPELRAWCARTLPEFMVPSGFVVLNRLPLNGNGKVDRAALPEPSDERPEQTVAYVAPRTPAEQSLARIWAGLLGLNRVGAQDSFFDLGGDSALAVGLVAQARQQGLRINTRTVFESRTLAEMAARCNGAPARAAGSTWQPEIWRDRVSTVHLNAGPPQRTVFCFHEVGGNVTAYSALARRLAPQAHLIGIEAASVGLGREPGGSVPEMASAYWAAIRALQPTGPYRLIGYSLGGAIAHAVVTLIEAGGGEVSLLTAVDSVLPVGPLADMLRQYAQRIEALTALAADSSLSGGSSEQARALARRLDLPDVVLTLPADDLIRRLRTMSVHTAALLSYRPARIHARVLLYQARQSSWVMPLRQGWAPYTTVLDARACEGDHLSIMRSPAVDRIADDLIEVFGGRLG